MGGGFGVMDDLRRGSGVDKKKGVDFVADFAREI